MLPILERLHYKPKADVATRVLVLVPTRELGAQVHAVTRDLLKVIFFHDFFPFIVLECYVCVYVLR